MMYVDLKPYLSVCGTCRYPLYLDQVSKAALHMSLWNDSLFLCRQNVVDYSLLVGLDQDNKVITVGIIGAHALTHVYTITVFLRNRPTNH